MTASNGTTDSSDPAAIEADIESTRARLAGTVDELAVRIHPKVIAQRGTEDAKARLLAATTTSDGQPRTERLAAIGGGVVAFLMLAIWRRGRRRRR